MRKRKKLTTKKSEKLSENNLKDSILDIFGDAEIQDDEFNRIAFILKKADENLFPSLQKIFNENKATFQLVEKIENRLIRVVICL